MVRKLFKVTWCYLLNKRKMPREMSFGTAPNGGLVKQFHTRYQKILVSLLSICSIMSKKWGNASLTLCVPMDEITRNEESQIPTLTLLPITSEILWIVWFKMLSYERALNFLSNGGFFYFFGTIRTCHSCLKCDVRKKIPFS